MRIWNAKMLTLALLGSVLLLLGVAQGQSEKRVKMKDLPKAVQQTVQEQSKGATLKGLAKEVEEGKTFYEAELMVNGHTKDVLIDPSGAVVEVEEEMPLTSLPAEVKAEFEKQAGKGKILKVESVTKGGTLAFYEAKIKKAGKTSEVKVGPDGKVIGKDK